MLFTDFELIDLEIGNALQLPIFDRVELLTRHQKLKPHGLMLTLAQSISNKSVSEVSVWNFDREYSHAMHKCQRLTTV
jgi:hypothetical protein